jgi:flagellar assembly factor FliW
MQTAELTDMVLPMPRNGDIIELPVGLLGFEQFKQYVWIESPQESPFSWIQARQDPSLIFLLVPMAAILDNYAPEISDEDAEFLELSSPMDAEVYGIVTLHGDRRATVNLKGPILINRSTMRGKQVVLTNASEFPLQHPLPTGE